MEPAPPKGIRSADQRCRYAPDERDRTRHQGSGKSAPRAIAGDYSLLQGSRGRPQARARSRGRLLPDQGIFRQWNLPAGGDRSRWRCRSGASKRGNMKVAIVNDSKMAAEIL